MRFWFIIAYAQKIHVDVASRNYDFCLGVCSSIPIIYVCIRGDLRIYAGLPQPSFLGYERSVEIASVGFYDLAQTYNT